MCAPQRLRGPRAPLTVSDASATMKSVSSSSVPSQPASSSPPASPDLPAPGVDLAAVAGEVLAELAGGSAVLRPDQLVAIDALVTHQRRVLLVQATGWGKSAVYWIATRLLRESGAGPTLVVSPLLALMRNQVRAASTAGIRAATINSSNIDDWHRIEAEIEADLVDVLLISPERLNNPRFRTEVLASLTGAVGMLVVDEAHCISDWGHDFRPDYRRIADVLGGLDPTVPVLAATATANERVCADLATQIGDRTLTLRGSLDRPSLHLSVAHLGTAPERLAWLAGWARAHGGPGLVYCLTVSEAERTAEFLERAGVAAAAYTGATASDERERIEAALDRGTLSCVVATSALGMGYDNPNLSYVVHVGSPSSPIAYYQQVGRAGRGSVDAQVVLMPTRAERDVWSYFDATAMPPEGAVVEVLQALRIAGPVALTELESMVNLRRGRLEALLKVLDVEGAVTRDGSSWSLSDLPWAYDSERYAQLAEARAAEQAAMVSYQEHTGCRLRFLREQLDDVEAVDCGRCDNCTGTRIETAVDAAAAAEALAFVRSAPVVLDPRKQWPRGLEGRSGNIPPDLRAEEGRALAFASDPGWSEELAERFALRDSAPDEDLLRAVAAALKAWPWGRRPTWVTWVPSRTRPELVRGLARQLADVGRMEIVDAVRRTRQDAPPQARMDNSCNQAANVLDAFEFGRADGEVLPAGPCLLIDDTYRSGWTATVVAEGLRNAGAGPVLPFALWRRP